MHVSVTPNTYLTILQYVNCYLESRQTLFKWNVGVTRVALRILATAIASQICSKKSLSDNHQKWWRGNLNWTWCSIEKKRNKELHTWRSVAYKPHLLLRFPEKIRYRYEQKYRLPCLCRNEVHMYMGELPINDVDRRKKSRKTWHLAEIGFHLIRANAGYFWVI